MPADVYVVYVQQRRAAVREAEQALEADRLIEVSPHGQEPLPECLESGQLACAQAQPRRGIGGDRDVGLASRHAPAHTSRVRGAADLPSVADVAEPDMAGGVEAGVGPEVSVRQRPERCLDRGEQLRT